MALTRLNVSLLQGGGQAGMPFIGQFVPVTRYMKASDNEDITFAIERAIAAGEKNILLPVGTVQWKRTITLTDTSDIRIAGHYGLTYVQTPVATDATGSAMITGLVLVRCRRIKLMAFHLDGGYRNVITQKRAVRLVRVQNCEDVELNGFSCSHAGDWAVSFEGGKNYRVFNYSYHYGEGTDGLWGGRDGLHFIDCSQVMVNGFYIVSGDDSVGCTVQNVGQNDVTIMNGFVHSKLASGVIFNEEGKAVYPMKNIRVVNIFALADMGNYLRNIVRVYTINAGTQINNVHIENIQGHSYAEGVWVSGNSTYRAEQVVIRDINVTTHLNAHGCRIQRCNDVSISGYATTLSDSNTLFDGWHIEDVDGLTADCLESRDAAYYGINMLRVTNFYLYGRTRNCGRNQYVNNRGGSLLLNACSNGKIFGQFLGEAGATYAPLSWSGNNDNVRFEPGTIFTGREVPPLRGMGNIEAPDVYAAFKFNNGSLAFGEKQGCDITTEGNAIVVTYNTARRSTYYDVDIRAYHVGKECNVSLVTINQNQVKFKVLDSAGGELNLVERVVVEVHQTL